jgi:phosphonate transport system ATP-binding protein
VPPRALLLSLHRPDLLAGFDRVIALRQGRLVLDAPAAAVDAAVVLQLYGAADAAP